MKDGAPDMRLPQKSKSINREERQGNTPSTQSIMNQKYISESFAITQRHLRFKQTLETALL